MSDRPTSTWKVADIKSWLTEQDVDLPSTTAKKSDYLALVKNVKSSKSSSSSGTSVDYMTLKKPELVEYLNNRGINTPSRATKKDLVKLIEKEAGVKSKVSEKPVKRRLAAASRSPSRSRKSSKIDDSSNKPEKKKRSTSSSSSSLSSLSTSSASSRRSSSLDEPAKKRGRSKAKSDDVPAARKATRRSSSKAATSRTKKKSSNFMEVEETTKPSRRTSSRSGRAKAKPVPKSSIEDSDDDMIDIKEPQAWDSVGVNANANEFQRSPEEREAAVSVLSRRDIGQDYGASVIPPRSGRRSVSQLQRNLVPELNMVGRGLEPAGVPGELQPLPQSPRHNDDEGDILSRLPRDDGDRRIRNKNPRRSKKTDVKPKKKSSGSNPLAAVLTFLTKTVLRTCFFGLLFYSIFTIHQNWRIGTVFCDELTADPIAGLGTVNDVPVRCVACPTNGNCANGILTCEEFYTRSGNDCKFSSVVTRLATEMQAFISKKINDEYVRTVCSGEDHVSHLVFDVVAGLVKAEFEGRGGEDKAFEYLEANIVGNDDSPLRRERSTFVLATPSIPFGWCRFKLFVMENYEYVFVSLFALFGLLYANHLWSKHTYRKKKVAQVADKVRAFLSSKRKHEPLGIGNLEAQLAPSDDDSIWEMVKTEIEKDPRIQTVRDTIGGTIMPCWRWNARTPYAPRSTSFTGSDDGDDNEEVGSPPPRDDRDAFFA